MAFDIPLLWLGQFLSKTTQQQRRLYAEYTHKHTSAATFIGLKNELSEMKKRGYSEEERKLIQGFIDAMYMNASKTLDKNIVTYSPNEQILEFLKTCEDSELVSQILKTYPFTTK